MNRIQLLALAALSGALVLGTQAGAQPAADRDAQTTGTCPVCKSQTKAAKMGKGRRQMLAEGGAGSLMGPRAGRQGGGRMMGGPGGPGGGMVDFHLAQAEELKLSEAQVTTLRAQAFEFRKGAVAARAAVETAELELENLHQTEPADAKKVEAKIREIFAKRADLAVAAFAAQQAADQVLTPDQRAQAGSQCGPEDGPPFGPPWLHQRHPDGGQGMIPGGPGAPEARPKAESHE